MVVGFVLVVAFYYMTYGHGLFNNRQTEKFVDSSSGSSGSTSGTGDAASSQLKPLPKRDNVVFYTQLFTDEQIRSGNSWFADVPIASAAADDTNHEKFTLTGSGLNYTNGLAMSGMLLDGPRARSFSTTAASYRLSSFTVSFFGKFNTLTNLPITLFIMPAETTYRNTPTIVKLSILSHPTDATNVVVKAEVGRTVASWDIPKTTLITGQNNLYTFVYDASSTTSGPSVKFYIGTSAPNVFTPAAPGSTGAAAEATPSEDIILGNSQVQVNKETKLDMNLYAFIYYNVAFGNSDQQDLYDYFTQESSGISRLIRSAVSAQSALDSAQQTHTANLSRCQNSLASCRSDLQTAQAAAAAAKERSNPWQVNLDERNGASASTNDLNKCSPLSVRRFGALTGTDDTDQSTDTGNNSSGSGSGVSSGTSRGRISYPPNLPSNFNLSYGIGPLTVFSNPTLPASPNPPVVPQMSESDAAFWRGLFDVVLKGQAAGSGTGTGTTSTGTNSTSANAGTTFANNNVSLNDVYATLAANANKDSTRPGTGSTLAATGLASANQKAVSQTPLPPASSAPPAPANAFWL